jgi:magnesium chelatase subunit D
MSGQPARGGFPFTAIVGMDELRLALVLNAVSPAVGGVLVRGEKGTAKSTMVRALAAVLPDVDVIAGCRFSCDPADPDPDCPDGPHPPAGQDPGVRTRAARLVELPVGASEDRLLGALDIERALTEGVKAYEPGLLAAAHRGVLYVDEVNLLHDHLVDLLLDAAALGVSYVERDGVSVRHAARFLLVGTMNPEEGELRPQLLDRFGLTVEAAAPRDPGPRAEVVRRRLDYDADPAGFAARWGAEESGLAGRIAAARRLLPRVVLPDSALRQVASVCAAFGVDGLRADLVTARAAMAHAAWAGRTVVGADDIRAAARLALPHRRRRQPFDAPQLDEQQLEDALAAGASGDDEPDPGGPGSGRPDSGGPDAEGPDSGGGDPDGPDPGGADPDGPDASGPDSGGADPGPGSGGGRPADPATPNHPSGNTSRDDPGSNDGPRSQAGDPAAEPAAPEATFRVRRLEVPGIGAGAAGRRSRARGQAGRVTGSRRPPGPVRQVHLTATLTAAAPYQVQRGRTGPGGLRLRHEDLRETRREGREGNLVLFLVDASGSMAARARMGAVKGAVLSLLLDAYQRRDKVGMITFSGSAARVLLPPTSSVEAAAARLADLPTGGRTPLAAGLLRAHEVLRTERLRDPDRRPLLVVVTDGRATSAATARPATPAPAGTAIPVGPAGTAIPVGPTGSATHPAVARTATTSTTTITPTRTATPISTTTPSNPTRTSRPASPVTPTVTSGSTARPADPVAAAHQAAGLLAATRVTSVVVDCESGAIRLGLAAGLARALDGTLLQLDELAAGPLADSVRAFTFPPHPGPHHEEVA